MKTYIFENKENYLNMKQTWAQYFNTEARKLERNEYGNKIKKLTATHFVLYAILRGKDPLITINNCCWETLQNVGYDINHAHDSKWYNGKWAKFFGLTEEEEKRMILVAYDIFHNHKDFETVQNNLKDAVTA